MTDAETLRDILKNFADDIKTELKKDIAANADISIKNHEETRKDIGGIRSEVHGLTSTVNILWRKVNGPNVPPPKTSGEYRQVDATLANEKPLSQSVSDHNLDLLSLKGQVQALDVKFETRSKELSDQVETASSMLGEQVAEAKEIAKQVLAMNQKQNESLGIGVSIRRVGEFFVWAKTKEGQRYVATIFAAATSLITALGTTYALMTNRLPAPTDPAPSSIHTVYVPVLPATPPPSSSGAHGSSAQHP